MVLFPILSTGKAPAAAREDSPLSVGCSDCFRLWLWALQVFQENTLPWAIGLTDGTKNCSLMEQEFCSQWREIRVQFVSDKVSWIVILDVPVRSAGDGVCDVQVAHVSKLGGMNPIVQASHIQAKVKIPIWLAAFHIVT